jgi:hypothetical protein
MIRGSNTGSGEGALSSPKRPDLLWGTRIPCAKDIGSISEWIKRMGRQDDHFHLVQWIKISRALPPHSTYVFVSFWSSSSISVSQPVQLWLVSRKKSIWYSSRHDRPPLITIWIICLRISCNVDSVKMVITSWEMCVYVCACVRAPVALSIRFLKRPGFVPFSY